MLGAVMYLLAYWINLSSRGILVMGIGCLLLVTGLIEISGRRVPLVQWNRETPRSWVSGSLTTWTVKNGAILGSGVFTRLGFAGWYLMPCVVLVSPNLALSVLVFGAYGLTRTACVFDTLSVVNRRGFALAARSILGERDNARIWSAILVAGVGSQLMVLSAGWLL